MNAAHADAVQACRVPEVAWHTQHPRWMANTKVFSAVALASGYLNKDDADPLRFCPMARTAKTLPQSACDGAHQLLSAFLQQPTREAIQQHSFTVNTWRRQWSEELRLAILKLLLPHVSGNGG
eukprot:7696314-Heterocapsa_arctica.AAC.1